jgi:hypothetical protein
LFIFIYFDNSANNTSFTHISQRFYSLLVSTYSLWNYKLRLSNSKKWTWQTYISTGADKQSFGFNPEGGSVMSMWERLSDFLKNHLERCHPLVWLVFLALLKSYRIKWWEIPDSELI